MLFAENLRVDVDEAAQVLADTLPDVDLWDVGHPDRATESFAPDAPEHLTPLERLRATPGVLVSRDFRDAGSGATWDRVRDYDPDVHGWPRNKSRGQARGVLPWAKIDTIVLHTAGVAGLHPDRWLGVPCHAAVANDATVVLCHTLNSYLWAAHRANRYSVSIEIAGNRAITPAQVAPARALLRYVVDELRRVRPPGEDGKPRPLYVAPHRFYHSSRAKDCDVQIWHEVGEWGAQELGLGLGRVDGGRPLPF